MARPRLGEGETHRLHVKISEEELAAIDDWRFTNRVDSRSEAVRKLVQLGAVAEESLNDVARPLYEAAETLVAQHAEDYVDVSTLIQATIHLVEAHDRMDALAKRMNSIHDAADIREGIRASQVIMDRLLADLDAWRGRMNKGSSERHEEK